MNILKAEFTLKGTLTKEEAIAYVGTEEFFTELERDFGLCPCRDRKTRIRYRIAELDRCLEEAQREVGKQRAARGGRKN